MRLEDRLNQALKSRNLLGKAPAPAHVPTPPSAIAEAGEPQSDEDVPPTDSFPTLDAALAEATSLPWDEDGVRVAIVTNVALSGLSLPKRMDRWMIEDIQRRPDGRYEVHLVEAENNQR